MDYTNPSEIAHNQALASGDVSPVPLQVHVCYCCRREVVHKKSVQPKHKWTICGTCAPTLAAAPVPINPYTYRMTDRSSGGLGPTRPIQANTMSQAQAPVVKDHAADQEKP